MKALLLAAVLATALAPMAFANPYCSALMSAETVPAKHAKRAPYRTDDAGRWIIARDQLKNEFEVTPEAGDLLHDIGAAFRATGTELVILTAPPRPVFAPDAALAQMGLDRNALKSGIGAAFSGYIAALNAAGLPAPDLSDLADGPLRDAYFFARDTHWTPRGAAASAQRLAQMWAPEVAADAAAPVFDQTYSERGSLSIVVAEVCGITPEPEVVAAPSYAAAGSAAALLGDATPARKVALVGTSFSNRYKRDAYQAADALAHYMEGSVANYSLAGGGPTGAMLAFVESGALAAGDYDVVVWESPYTTPLNGPHGLRQVLGALRAFDAQQMPETHSATLSDQWTNLPMTFDADEFAALQINIPGTTEGKLYLELISGDGTKQKVTLVKSKRVPAERRTAQWHVALSALEAPDIERVKLRLRGAPITSAEVRLMR